MGRPSTFPTAIPTSTAGRERCVPHRSGGCNQHAGRLPPPVLNPRCRCGAAAAAVAGRPTRGGAHAAAPPSSTFPARVPCAHALRICPAHMRHIPCAYALCAYPALAIAAATRLCELMRAPATSPGSGVPIGPCWTARCERRRRQQHCSVALRRGSHVAPGAPPQPLHPPPPPVRQSRLVDSDDEVDTEWIRKQNEALIDEFVDVSSSEKAFMKVNPPRNGCRPPLLLPLQAPPWRRWRKQPGAQPRRHQAGRQALCPVQDAKPELS